MSTLAGQLAPLVPKPQPNPNAWRALLKPKELAKYDGGDYHAINYDTGAMDLHKAPRESALISRDLCLDEFEDENPASAKGTPTPEENTLAAELVKGFEVIGGISKPCVTCGQMQPGQGESRVVILRYGHDSAKAFILCDGCFDALGLDLTPDPFLSGLPAFDQRVWEFTKDGLTGVEIARRLSVNSQRVTQQQVSEAKLRVQRAITENARLNRQSKTYGQRIQ